jgi:peptidoglycan biosynthesis protein MviN/MurJ (putative lipid II flippase)
VALASLIMGAGLWALMQWLLPWFDAALGWRVAGLALLVGGGLGLYALLALALGALRLDELKALRRPPAAPPS